MKKKKNKLFLLFQIILTLTLLAKGVLALVGFGSIGITAGSWAARFMARMAVNGVTAAGGCVACLQHFTMT